MPVCYRAIHSTHAILSVDCVSTGMQELFTIWELQRFYNIHNELLKTNEEAQTLPMKPNCS